MIQPLFTLVFAEMGLVLTLLFRTPLRKPVTMGLDGVKQGRGPVIVQTVAATLFAVLISIVYSITKIQKRSQDAGSVNPTDQVLLANHLLEASLLGFSLFLGLIIDRLHYYIEELRRIRKNLEAVKKQEQGYEAMKSRAVDDNETKLRDEAILAKRTQNRQLESKSQKS
ncbi:unnamed protein product [Ilex paraguariensis]|uniref:Endoplasmic reticulum transmembrane protein n=1 Tax=Ilex paraguariensis TaxID=185542 RepID=A0ABC8T3D4_9AQUA